MKITPIKTRIFREKEKLLPFIEGYYSKPKNGDILVVTSKIVALSEGRTIINSGKEAKINLIKKESEFAIETKYTWLTIKDGVVMAAAGVDESNADGKIIMLPKDSFKQAKKIRDYFMKKYKLNNFGVIITDSRCMPLRAGITGVAVGYAGFKGLKDYRGKPDIFGRILKITRIDAADSLATAAVFCMGEADERQPLSIISDAVVEWTKTVNPKELWMDPKEDMYRPLFDNIRKIKK